MNLSSRAEEQPGPSFLHFTFRRIQLERLAQGSRAQAGIKSWPFTRRMTFSKSLYLARPQFLHLESGGTETSP